MNSREICHCGIFSKCVCCINEIFSRANAICVSHKTKLRLFISSSRLLAAAFPTLINLVCHSQFLVVVVVVVRPKFRLVLIILLGSAHEVCTELGRIQVYLCLIQLT